MFGKKHVMMNYNKIADYLYVGSNFCCQMDFDKMLIQKEGIAADVSIEDERVDAPFGLKFFLWLPTKDNTAPTFDQLKAGANFIKEMIDQKKPVYIHCKNGHGRAPTMAAAYLIMAGMGVDEAIALLKKQRPEVHPVAEQIEALRKFSQNK
ncbi:MAG: protein phosphatase [Candidatus Buchananbacteria bacterium CG10_big_fil_rev_8_21_14_0_10_42_9]|uniref:Protein phosphatase n=1 Tax=Candidatus Buchananbacteria bacterium CG10_big_fil_rev_8_21_14_0_10_42_9 TaxID=1974526 RepID=A0A2H0W1V8_9BACT|nr:MAG: protein phosphatase [Candidatus Buchananbacteria bacterium CG10_big_fil_rev_8_21_14_0_10_42_9]